MKKRILTVIVTLLTTLGARCGEPVWWGFWNSTMPVERAAALYEGITTCALRLTATANPAMAGSRLHGVRFYISDKTAVTRAWVWASVKQFNWSATSVPDVVVQEVDPAALRDVAHDGLPTEVLLTEAVSLMGQSHYASVYVGYAIELKGAAAAPCHAMSAGAAQGSQGASCLLDWTDRRSQYGALAMQLLVSSDHIAPQGVAVQSVGEQLLLAGGDRELTLTLQNDGAAAVHSVDCQVVLDDVPQPLQHVALPQPVAELGATFTLPLTVSLPAEARVYDCQVSVVSVNGTENASAGASLPVGLTALSQLPLRRTVMEELTGTWCPNCPRGLVGMRLLEERFGDRFIGIAIHGGDASEPMRLANYDGSNFVRSLSSRMGGRPSCAVDRTIDCDPYGGVGSIYHFGADAVVQWLLAQPTTADVDLSAHWTADGSGISMDVATTFRYSASAAEASPYALMLVVTADSLQGEGSDWLQVNTLVGKTDYDSDLDEFVYGQRYMALHYNHVPIYADGVEQGVAGSVSTPWQADVPQHYVCTIPMAGNPLVQHPAQLHAIAMLIDTRTGQVANAAQAHVEGDTNGLRHVLSTTATAVRFSTVGGRVAHPDHGHGLLIGRRPDGSVVKVVR